MRILFINQFFWPDAAPTGLLLEDVTRELAARGHAVEVLCGSGCYEAKTTAPPPPAVIHRVSDSDYSRGRLGRLISWCAFLVRAGFRSLFLPRYDLVVAMTTPPGLSYLAWMHRLRGARFWIWEMDLYPDVAVATGVLRSGSIAARLSEAVMDMPRRRADGVLVLGDCMRKRLTDRGLPEPRLKVAENWADGSQIIPSPMPPAPPFQILYSGNLGVVHDIETISSVLELLQDDARFRFLFAGGGVRFQELRSFCLRRRLKNVEFLPYQDAKSFSRRLAACHVGLVTLRPGCEGTVVPSKLYSLLAAGRPVLYIGPETASPASALRENRCGWSLNSGDAMGVVAVLWGIAGRPEVLQEYSDNGRTGFLARYDKRIAVPRLTSLLLENGNHSQ